MMGGLGHLDNVTKRCWEIDSLSIIFDGNAFGLGVEKCSLVPVEVWYYIQ